MSLKEDSMVKIVREYIDDKKWRREEFDYDSGNIVYKVCLQMEHSKYITLYDIDPVRYRFGIFAYGSVIIPENDRVKVAEFFIRTNLCQYTGKFDLDMEDGEWRFSTTVNIKGSQLSKEMIDDMGNIALIELDSHFPAVMAIVHGGKSANDSFEAFFGNDT